MRHLEDDTAKDFRNAPEHMCGVHAHAHIHTHILSMYSIEKQLGDKQSGRVRDGTRKEV